MKRPHVSFAYSDSPGGCPKGKSKAHGGVVKTEYLQDPKGRNLNAWPLHMDD